MSHLKIVESVLVATTVSGSLAAWLELVEGVSKTVAAVCAALAGILWVLTRGFVMRTNYYEMQAARQRAMNPPDAADDSDSPPKPP